jgi:hypothetical protein
LSDSTKPTHHGRIICLTKTTRANKYGGISKTHFSSADESIDPIEPTTFQQSGGTATTAYGGWTTTLTKTIIKDPTGLGRWRGVIVGGKQDKPLAIITGYRVCDQSRTAAGESTSCAREWEYLREQGIESPDPRQQFVTDMTTQILSLQKKHDVLLMFDANEFLTTKAMSEFTTKYGLRHETSATK